MSDVKNKADHLIEVITDRYEADSLSTVAERLHHRLIEVGWELPNAQFYVTREGSTFNLEFLPLDPIQYLDAVHQDDTAVDAAEVLSQMPVYRQPTDLPPFAGLIVTGECWSVTGKVDTDVLHPIWEQNIGMHPDREDARRTMWASPTNSGLIYSRATGDHDSTCDHSAALLQRIAKVMAVLVGAKVQFRDISGMRPTRRR